MVDYWFLHSITISSPPPLPLPDIVASPAKVQVVACLALYSHLLTSYALSCRYIADIFDCTLCHSMQETVETFNVATVIGYGYGSSPIQPPSFPLFYPHSMASMSRAIGVSLISKAGDSTALGVLWCLRKERNNRIFDRNNQDISILIFNLIFMVNAWLQLRS